MWSQTELLHMWMAHIFKACKLMKVIWEAGYAPVRFMGFFFFGTHLVDFTADACRYRTISAGKFTAKSVCVNSRWCVLSLSV